MEAKRTLAGIGRLVLDVCGVQLQDANLQLVTTVSSGLQNPLPVPGTHIGSSLSPNRLTLGIVPFKFSVCMKPTI